MGELKIVGILPVSGDWCVALETGVGGRVGECRVARQVVAMQLVVVLGNC